MKKKINLTFEHRQHFGLFSFLNIIFRLLFFFLNLNLDIELRTTILM